MKWTDVSELAVELSEAHPDVDPLKLKFCRPDELGDCLAWF